MDEHTAGLEARLAAAEESLRALGRHLAVHEDGLRVTAPLRVTDSEGKTMLLVDLDASGPRVSLLNADGKPRMVLHVLETGGSISLSNGTGRAVALLFAEESGGSLALYDNDGNLLIEE